jgi:hypothetical protein
MANAETDLGDVVSWLQDVVWWASRLAEAGRDGRVVARPLYRRASGAGRVARPRHPAGGTLGAAKGAR